MPLGTLRFCPTCLTTDHDSARSHCAACGSALRPFFDEQGAISGEFLRARGHCCGSGCRNCPYPAATGSVKEKVCQRCGEHFQCRREGCWCETVCVDAVQLQRLRAAYVDCLCPACLGSFATSSTASRG